MFEKADQYKAQLDAWRPLEGNLLKQVRDYYKIGLTYSSNALEGNSLTETETKIVLEDGLTMSGNILGRSSPECSTLCQVYSREGGRNPKKPAATIEMRTEVPHAQEA